MLQISQREQYDLFVGKSGMAGGAHEVLMLSLTNN